MALPKILRFDFDVPFDVSFGFSFIQFSSNVRL